jgi:hypothetical protein
VGISGDSAITCRPIAHRFRHLHILNVDKEYVVAIVISPFSKSRPTIPTILGVVLLLGSLFTFTLVAQELIASVRTQLAQVEVRTQAGVPLTITSINVISTDPNQPVFTYEVVNAKDKPVSAYAIRHDVTTGTTETSGVSFTSLWTVSSLLYPQTRTPEEFGRTTYGATVSKVVLSVDFVEFADGSTWGFDTFKMSEKLAGRRAGGQATLKTFREKSKTHGLSMVSSALEEEPSLAPQADKSPIWKDGFEEGIRIVRIRLQHAQRKGGLSALESELLQPFDISDGRQ